MAERPHNFSDHDNSLDGELVVALTQVDVVIEKYIRKTISDYEYEAYEARVSLENVLDNSMGKEVQQVLGKPIDHIMEQAAELAEDMINEGKDEKEARRRAAAAAHEALFADRTNPADKDYLDAYSDITDALETSVHTSLMEKYPDIEVAGVDGAMLSLMFTQRTDSAAGLGPNTSLRVGFSVDGSKVDTSVFFFHTPRNSPEMTGVERVELDPTEYEGVIGGVDFALLKQDALEALQTALRDVA